METAERLLRLPEVIERTGLSRSSLYQRINQGTFPKPIKLGKRASAWPCSEIDQWVELTIQTGRAS